MNTQALVLPISSIHSTHVGSLEAADKLYYQTFDPLELEQILNEGIIRTNDQMQKETSVRLMPGLLDCVNLYSIQDLKANFCSGIGLILDANSVPTYLPHYGPRDYKSLVCEYHRGDINLKNSLIGLYYIKGDNSDLEIYHPHVSFTEFLDYLEIRSQIYSEHKFVVKDDYLQTKRFFAQSLMKNYGVSNVFEFLNLMVFQYISSKK